MAFRTSTRGRSTSSDTRRFVVEWLREIFLEDLGLKLVALIIAVGLWLAVTGLRAPATVRLRGVPLEFIKPENVDIGNEPLEEVDVTLEGSQGRLAEVNARNLVARADITQLRPGERVVRLTPESVAMEVPAGVRIVAIEPRTVALRLEPIVDREVEVETRFEGQVPEGYTLGTVQVTPPRIHVRGPESHVLALGKAQTETISLSGQRETFLTQTAIDTANLRVVPVEAAVSVRIEIAEERVERRLTDVPVVAASGGAARPATASATLRGPRSVMSGLGRDVRIILDVSADGSIRPRLGLPANLEGRVELVSTIPSEFSIDK